MLESQSAGSITQSSYQTCSPPLTPHSSPDSTLDKPPRYVAAVCDASSWCICFPLVYVSNIFVLHTLQVAPIQIQFCQQFQQPGRASFGRTQLYPGGLWHWHGRWECVMLCAARRCHFGLLNKILKCCVVRTSCAWRDWCLEAWSFQNSEKFWKWHLWMQSDSEPEVSVADTSQHPRGGGHFSSRRYLCCPPSTVVRFNHTADSLLQESMSSAETPNHTTKRMSLSNSFSDDQGYHAGIPEQDGEFEWN